jgi:hypothetical protein
MRHAPQARPTPRAVSATERAPAPDPFVFTLRTAEYRAQPIPGLQGAKLGDCFVGVAELPEQLEEFMEVNPRVPKRTGTNVLSGPVIKGITKTLTEDPENMALKNQGIYLLVHEADFVRAPGGDGKLTITLSDKNRHGIVNGGHTFAAIRDAIDNADDMEAESLACAYVRLHVLSGVPEAKVPEIAEGLNRSKQVDDPSLIHLRGHFEDIKKVMEDKPGADDISYSQGEKGGTYITEVLVMLEMFNCGRFDRKRHPQNLFSRAKTALEFYETDYKAAPSPLKLLVPKLPEILVLSDRIKQATPDAATKMKDKDARFEFGRMKVGKERAGSQSHKNDPLPFLGSSVDYHVPNGWLYPMLAAFRANVDWDLASSKFAWKVSLEDLLPQVIDDLVRVCVTEHRDNHLKPDQVGKRESTYAQCYDKVALYLLERN